MTPTNNPTTSPQPGTTRTRQFRRDPSAVPSPGSWTDRDEAILGAVALHRFITAEQIHFLVGGSFQKLQRRLQQLYHHAYLDRPKAQLRLWAGARRMSFVYALGDEGAKHLRGKGAGLAGDSHPRYWTTKNLKVRSPHLSHSLAITSFGISLARAARAAGTELTWQRESADLRDHALVKNSRGRLERIPINPDAFFTLAWPYEGKTRHRAFFLEADLGTEPLERSDPAPHTRRLSDVVSKLRAYWQWGYIEHRHRQKLHIPGFVVLVAADSETRLCNMLEAAKAVDPKHTGSSMFWFATFQPHDDSQRLLAPIWQSPNGQMHALTE